MHCEVKQCPWIDDEMKSNDNGMMPKKRQIKLALFNKQSYCKLRNLVTNLNKGKKKEFYQHKIVMGKTLWRTLNAIMGRNLNMSPSFVESEGICITKTHDITNK